MTADIHNVKMCAAESLLPVDVHQRVLLVDDEHVIRFLFRTILSANLPHCEIAEAVNGADAVESFRHQRCQVIVMDLHIPEKDGVSAFLEIQALCAANGWQMPAVVFCTGFAPPDALRKILGEKQQHMLLAKPVKGDHLVRAVRERLI